MKVYLVGGAVRDELLGRPVSDRDWVVVDSTVSDMLAAGFQQVGRDFPVFLHPETHQEYALARIERKVGAGHQGFVCHTGPDVSLEDDLKRRDLTINAMARDAGGNLIDPYGGEEDLKNYRLQHVSDAFSEDPLRVFRVARFAAELHGFKASPETLNLMRDMASAGTLDELPAERVWAETIKALSGPDPQHYFAVLHGVGALLPWFVELDGLAWNESADLIPDELLDPLLRFGVLGWWLTAGQAQALVDRLKPPNDYSDLLVQCATNARLLVRWREQSDVDVYRAMTQCGAFRSHPRWQQLFQILDSISRTDLSSLEQVVNTMRQIHGRDFAADGISGGEIGRRLMQARLAVLRKELES